MAKTAESTADLAQQVEQLKKENEELLSVLRWLQNTFIIGCASDERSLDHVEQLVARLRVDPV